MSKVIRISKTNERLIQAIRSAYNEKLKEDGIEFLLNDDQNIIQAALIEMLKKIDPETLMKIFHKQLEERDF